MLCFISRFLCVFYHLLFCMFLILLWCFSCFFFIFIFVVLWCFLKYCCGLFKMLFRFVKCCRVHLFAVALCSVHWPKTWSLSFRVKKAKNKTEETLICFIVTVGALWSNSKEKHVTWQSFPTHPCTLRKKRQKQEKRNGLTQALLQYDCPVFYLLCRNIQASVVNLEQIWGQTHLFYYSKWSSAGILVVLNIYNTAF